MTTTWWYLMRGFLIGTCQYLVKISRHQYTLGFPLFQLQLQLYLVGKKMNINPNNKNRQQKEI